MSNSVNAQLEEEIKNAFAQSGEDEKRAARLLSLMPLKPIEALLFKNYKVWTGDGRLKFPPMTVIRAMLLKELKDIRSCQQLIAYLYANPEEGRLLGFGRFLPSTQTFSIMKRERIDGEIQQQMDFVVERIREIACETGRLFDMEFIPANNCKGVSHRTVQRHLNMHGSKVTRLMKRAVLPLLNLPETERHVYKNSDLLNAMGFMAERHVCANQGCGLMRADEMFAGRAPHGRTLLGRLAALDAPDVCGTSYRFFDMMYNLAKSNVQIPNCPVVLAIDYTEIPIYGDSDDRMVVGGKRERGTCKKHKYLVIKISARWGDLFLLALPVGAFTDERNTLRELIEYAMKRVKIDYIVVDKGFFAAKFVSLFDEMCIRYLMPAVKNGRIKRLIEEGKGDTRYVMRSHDNKYKAHTTLAFRKASNGDTVCFATNIPVGPDTGDDLFSFYRRRWNVETGFRVIKHEFMAKTTSKRHSIRFLLFSFSMLLYNAWVVVNAALNKAMYGEPWGKRLLSAKLFMIRFYGARMHYDPPPVCE